MKKRNELPKLDESLFKVIENKKLSFIVGGSAKTHTSTSYLGKGGTLTYDDGVDA